MPEKIDHLLLQIATQKQPRKTVLDVVDIFPLSQDDEDLLNLKPLELKKLKGATAAADSSQSPDRNSATQPVAKSAKQPIDLTVIQPTPPLPEPPTVYRSQVLQAEPESEEESPGPYTGPDVLSAVEEGMSDAELRTQLENCNTALERLNAVICREVVGVRTNSIAMQSADVTALVKARLDKSKEAHVEHLKYLKGILKQRGASRTGEKTIGRRCNPIETMGHVRKVFFRRSAYSRLDEVTVVASCTSVEADARQALREYEHRTTRLPSVRPSTIPHEVSVDPSRTSTTAAKSSGRQQGSNWYCTYCTRVNSAGTSQCEGCKCEREGSWSWVVSAWDWRCPYCQATNTHDCPQCGSCKQERAPSVWPSLGGGR